MQGHVELGKKMWESWKNQTPDSKKQHKKNEELHSIVAEAVKQALKDSTSGKKQKAALLVEELDVFNMKEDFSQWLSQ